MHCLVPKGHVASTVPAELRAAPADELMLAQLLPRQLQLTEHTGLQTLDTVVRLEALKKRRDSDVYTCLFTNVLNIVVIFYT